MLELVQRYSIQKLKVALKMKRKIVLEEFLKAEMKDYKSK